MKISYKDCSYKELVDIIKDCQQELNNRGTVTECKIVPFFSNEKTKYITEAI